MNRVSIGGFIICISLLVAVAETWFFGWNMHPLTKAEWICDSIARTVCIFGCIVWLTGLIKYVKAKTND